MMNQKPFRGAQVNKTHPLIRDLAAYWIMNEQTGELVFDYSGNQSFGVVNSCTWVGDSLSLDGSTSHVNFGNNKSLDLSSAFSIGVWIKRDVVGTTQGVLVKGNTTGNANQPYSIYFGYNDTIRFNIGSGSGFQVLTGSVINDDKWHYVVATADDSTMTLYIDGEYDVSVSQTYLPFASSEVLLFGRVRLAAPSYLFSGLFKSGFLYNRCLSSDEVRYSYQNPYALFSGLFDAGIFYVVPGVSAIKTWNGLAIASVKTINGLAIASIKNINGLE